MDDIRCTQCGAVELEPGFIDDSGQGAAGYGKWIAGPLARGAFGGAKKMGRTRREISAHRCSICGHLELFAIEEC
ncbi:hypothetical protein [Streptomyces sp. NBC_00859]|uniref:hypothetical protein n=1 Tax=Streptomyces sp. NBC_00859 TaxID=2903682 RepID=UPI00386EAE06|nr:hypothetical protein OG584_20100 [Streptomyces sp. NBC_00859]